MLRPGVLVRPGRDFAEGSAFEHLEAEGRAFHARRTNADADVFQLEGEKCVHFAIGRRSELDLHLMVQRANGGEEEVYLGSADWMARNLYERVEVVFPVFDPMLKQRIRHEILEAYLRDQSKSRFLLPDGRYLRATEWKRGHRKLRMGSDSWFGKASLNSQEFLMMLAEGKQKIKLGAEKKRRVPSTEPS